MNSSGIVWHEVRERVRARALQLGFDRVGFARTEPFDALRDVLIARRARGHETPFEHRDIEDRVDARRSFVSDAQPRSFVSVAMAYPSRVPTRIRSVFGDRRGDIARSAWGMDYHDVLRARLDALRTAILEEQPDAHVVSIVDTGALVDRAVAQRAGVAWIGKNAMAITPDWGSWVYIGELVTDIPFPPDAPLEEACGSCTLCIDACPTDALLGDRQLDGSRCISAVTQVKGVVPDPMKRKIGARLYGCDTCQVVCPHNAGVHAVHHEEFVPDIDRVRPPLLPLFALTNREAKAQFGAAAWRGAAVLMRNAIIALGNARANECIDALAHVLMHDVRPFMRETAAWALGRMNDARARTVLDDCAAAEHDPVVREAIRRAQDRVLP
jgi:epoxyqueuosine reductase